MTEQSLGGLLRKGTELLKEAGIEEAGLDAWLLLEYIVQKNRSYFFAHQEELVEDAAAEQYLKLLERRAQHIPVQHLTHQAFFMGYEFYVNDHVLVPRQDTETLAEEAQKALVGRENPRILDMCTGSGCILLSLLLDCAGSRGTGVDLSEKALMTAKKNAERLGVSDRAEFVHSDLFSADFFCKNSGNPQPEYDILVSNPPYIPTEDIESLMEEVRLHDPRMALDGKEDGLFFYREITRQAAQYLKKGGWLLYEIGYDQGEAVLAILKKEGYVNTEIKQDLCGLDRVVLGQKAF